MKLRHCYLILCLPGAILPLSRFYPFLIEYGWDIPLFFRLLFANHISAFFAWDVIVSGIVLIVFIITEGIRLKIPYLWLPILGLSIGVSFALPSFLYVRQQQLDKNV